jgi:hypothetical protein
LRAITSDRPWASHPLGRSPGAALHQTDGELPSQGFTDDWARAGIGRKRRVARSATQTKKIQGFLITALLSLLLDKSSL